MRERKRKSVKWPILIKNMNFEQEIPVFIETGKHPQSIAVEEEVKKTKTYHIFVLLHGLDATHANMVKLMKYISMVCDNAEFILPKGKFILKILAMNGK